MSFASRILQMLHLSKKPKPKSFWGIRPGGNIHKGPGDVNRIFFMPPEEARRMADALSRSFPLLTPFQGPESLSFYWRGDVFDQLNARLKAQIELEAEMLIDPRTGNPTNTPMRLLAEELIGAKALDLLDRAGLMVVSRRLWRYRTWPFQKRSHSDKSQGSSTSPLESQSSQPVAQR